MCCCICKLLLCLWSYFCDSSRTRIVWSRFSWSSSSALCFSASFSASALLKNESLMYSVSKEQCECSAQYRFVHHIDGDWTHFTHKYFKRISIECCWWLRTYEWNAHLERPRMNNEKSSRMTAIKTAERITSLTTQADFFLFLMKIFKAWRSILLRYFVVFGKHLRENLKYFRTSSLLTLISSSFVL